MQENNNNEVKTEERIYGTVKVYFPERGYGFCQGDNKKDYFFHIKSVPEEQVLKMGDRIDFVPSQSLKGGEAKFIIVETGTKQPAFMNDVVLK
jgi:cold shock CspA family protein